MDRTVPAWLRRRPVRARRTVPGRSFPASEVEVDTAPAAIPSGELDGAAWFADPMTGDRRFPSTRRLVEGQPETEFDGKQS